MNEFTGSFVTFDNGWFATRGVNESVWRLSKIATRTNGGKIVMELEFVQHFYNLWEVRDYIESNSE